MPFVQLDDVTIHYRIQGEGPPLILLHGLGNNSRSWRHQLEGLSTHYTVIAWDAPGYGQSSDPAEEIHYFAGFAERLHQFIQKLQLGPIILLGHSMGSTLALEYVNKYPTSVKTLILADATRGGASKNPQVNEQTLAKRLTDISTLTPQELAKQRVSNLLSPHVTPEVKQEAEQVYAEIRPMGYRSVAHALYHADQTAILPTIHIPTLVICGELDTITPVSESNTIYEALPHAQLVLIPRTGHLCYQEDPASFNQAVLDFLED